MPNKDLSCRTILKFVRDEHEASKEYKAIADSTYLNMFIGMSKDEANHKNNLLQLGESQGCMEKKFFRNAINTLTENKQCIDLSHLYFEDLRLRFGRRKLRATLKSDGYMFNVFTDDNYDIHRENGVDEDWNQLEGIKQCSGKLNKSGCWDFSGVDKNIKFNFGDYLAVMEIDKSGIEIKVVDEDSLDVLKSEKGNWEDFNSIKLCVV